MPAYTFKTETGLSATVPVAPSKTIASEKEILDALFQVKDTLKMQVDVPSDLEVFHGHKREGDKYAFRDEEIRADYRDYEDHLKSVKVILSSN